jgi:hypothetical protein
MKPAILLLAAAAAWPQGQMPVKHLAAVNTAERPLLSFSVMSDLEAQLDGRINAAGGAEPIVLIGPARALYLLGYGAVVTQEVSLVVTPTESPFRGKITPQEIVQVHQRKSARLPLIRQVIRDMWTSTASTLNMVPGNEQIVIAVRLLYKPWEDTKGLPGQLILRGSRGAGIAGVQMEEQ